ncbi:MAG: DUF4149 domain-containing protein [Nitrospirae bacterium]|nr:DUF4149 domain-containing protein [Nitrospirota bacterium]MBI3595447.1 DUF4149 domain-containing protein [Nitrospirota bacterium]
MKGIFKFIHLFSLMVWFGGVIFFTTFVAPVMFRAFSTEQAGDVMGAIFPVYYLMGYSAGFLALISLYFSSKKTPWFRLILMTIMLVSTFYGGQIVGKKAGDLRVAIRHESDPGRKAILKENFHAEHRLSVISNSLVLLLIPVVVLLTSRKITDG